MIPAVPDHTVVFVVANIQGHPWRAIAAHKLITDYACHHVPPGDRRVIVHMGNYIGEFNYPRQKRKSSTESLRKRFRFAPFMVRPLRKLALKKMAKGSALENLKTLDHMMSFKPEGFDQIYLKGENEIFDFAKRRDGSDGLDQEVKNARREKTASWAIDLFEDARTVRNASVRMITNGRLQFLENLKTEHTEGDYLFCINAKPLPEGKYGVFSREGSSNFMPYRSKDHWMAFNIRTMPGVFVLRLQRDEQRLTVIGDHNIPEWPREVYDRVASGEVDLTDERYHFKHLPPLVLPNKLECPAWTAKVPVLG